jgi:hypothetical protein
VPQFSSFVFNIARIGKHAIKNPKLEKPHYTFKDQLIHNHKILSFNKHFVHHIFSYLFIDCLLFRNGNKKKKIKSHDKHFGSYQFSIEKKINFPIIFNVKESFVFYHIFFLSTSTTFNTTVLCGLKKIII